MRRSPIECGGDIPVKNTFVHFVEDRPIKLVERWSSCPGNLQPYRTEKMATMCTRDEDEFEVPDAVQSSCEFSEPSLRQPKTQPQSRVETDVDAEVKKDQELRLSKMINREITHAASKGNVRAVLDVTWHRLTSMNGVNLATALHRIARHSCEDHSQVSEVILHPCFNPMLKAIERKATFAMESGQDSNSAEAQSAGFPAQCASIIAWSCATLSVRDDRMLEVLAELAGPRLRELKPYEVTNLVWAFAKLSVPCTLLFRNAAQLLQTRQRGEYKVQCLSAAAWSFAKAPALPRTTQTQLFKSIGDEMAPQVNGLKAQEMANTVWSFGQLNVKHQRLFEEICQTITSPPGVSRFSVSHLSSIMMGFAKVHFQQPDVIGKICGVMLRNSHSLTPEQSSGLLWSLAELDVRDRSLLVQKLLDMAAADISSFKHQELNVLMWAARALCPKHQAFFDACKVLRGEATYRDGLPDEELTFPD
mmetsp:Transcript_37719/g.87247  ORF Transcript_37719/g.87247 Transcript_37719/m.87247 type:complete len:476 (-) Transcript_37719:142-1569(-)